MSLMTAYASRFEVLRDTEKCISCGACIRVCPEKARDYHGEAYLAARKGFEEKCAARREPELFYITS